MSMNIGVTCRFALVTLVLAVGVDRRCSPQALPAPEQKDADDRTPQQLTDRVLNSALPMSQRVGAYGKLAKFEPKDRDAAFVALVHASDESIAAMAAAALIRDRYPKVTELITPQIPRWSTSNQMVVLQAIRFGGEEQAFLDIPRTLMKQP